MKKLGLFSTTFGLISLPIASLIACGSFGDSDDEKNLQRDKKEIINPKDSYKTTRPDLDTLNFEIGESYDAAQLGIENVFSQDFEFEVKDYDDLRGMLTVSVEHTNSNSEINLLRDDVKITGFKTYNALEFLDKVLQELPDDKTLTSDLLDKPKPSELENREFLEVDDLGIGRYFKFRKAEHFITVADHNDLAGELVIDLKIAIAGQDKVVRLTVTDLQIEDSVLNHRLAEIRQIIAKLPDYATTTHSDKLPSAVVQRMVDADFWDQLGIGAFPDYDQQNIDVTFKIGKNTSDSSGQIELILTLKAANESSTVERSKTILISGFLSLNDVKHDQDRLQIQTIKNYLENDFNKETSLKTDLPSDVKKKFVADSSQSLDQLGLINLTEETLGYAEVTFTLGPADDQAGTLVLIALIKAGNAQAVETRLLIRGFATLQQIKEKERKEVEQELKNLLLHLQKNARRTSMRDKLPSQVGSKNDKVSFAKVGLQDLSNQVKSGILVELIIRDVNDEKGALDIEIILSKNGQKVDGKIVVVGYKQKIEAEEERKAEIRAQLSKLLGWISTHRSSTSIKQSRPSKIGSTGQTISLANLGLAEISDQQKDGATIEFKIVKPDDFEGEMTVEVLASKLGEKLRQTYTIIGYKTHETEIKDSFAWIKDKYARTVLEGELPTSVVKGRKKIEFKDLGFGELPPKLFGDYELDIEVANADDDNGLVVLKIVMRKGDLVKKMDHTVVGFKTSSQVINYLWGKLRWFERNRSVTIHENKLPSTIGYVGQHLTLEMLGLEKLTGSDFCGQSCPTIEFVLADADDVQGKVKVLVKLSYEGVRLEGEEVWVEIKGFKTVGKELEELKSSIEKEIWTTSFRDKFPTTVGDEDEPVTFQELGLDRLPFETKHDIEILLTILRTNDRQGSVKVKAVLKKQGQTRTAEFTVFGFKTTAEQIKELQNQAQRLAEWIQKNWLKTSQSDKLPSQVGSAGQEVSSAKLGLVMIPEQIRGEFDVLIKIDRVQNALGEIDIKVTIAHAQVKQVKMDKKLTVKGFKTTASITYKLNTLFNWIKKHRVVTNLSESMPSSLGKPGKVVSLREIGLSSIPSNVLQGIELRLTIEKPDDVAGEIIVKFVLSENGVEITKSLAITGFKKVAHQLSELLDLIKQRLQTVKLSDQLPSQIGKKGTKLTFMKLGLAELDSSELQGIKVEILVENADDKSGQLEITVRLNKLGKEQSETLTLSGFQKQSVLDRRAVDQLVEQIKELNHVDSSANEIVIKVNDVPDLYTRDVSEITIDEIKSNPSLWKIILPQIPSGVEVDWSLYRVTNESNKRLVLTLEISKGESKQRITFRIEGFEPLINKLIASHLDKFPFQVTTSLVEKRVVDFKVNQQYTFTELGVKHPDVVDKIFKFKLVVTDLNDKNGTVELRLTISADSTDFKKSKTILVAGYWSDAKRETSKVKIARFNEIFDNFNYGKPISDLSEEEVYRMPVYDKTSQSKLYIGDDKHYSVGNELSLDELKLQKTKFLNDQLTRLGSTYSLTFEIVERPESVRFHGNIRIRAVVRHVDVRIVSPAIVIGGFQSFESYFWNQVAIWKEKLPGNIRTNSQGSYVSLLDRLNMWNMVSNASNDWETTQKFMEATGLSQTFVGMHFGKNYQLEVKAVLASIAKDPATNYQLYEKTFGNNCVFEFVVGLKGDQWSHFNQKIYARSTNELASFFQNYEKKYRGKRSFSKTLTGFDSSENVNGAFESWIKKNQVFDVLSSDIDNTHSLGILRQIYGPESIPEFPHDFLKSPMYERKRNKLGPWLSANAELQHSKIEKLVVVNYKDSRSVTKWLEGVDQQNRYWNWNRIPVDWATIFDASLRPLVDQAQPYFRFLQIVPGQDGKDTLSFEVGLRYQTISPKKDDLPARWSEQNVRVDHFERGGLRILKSHFNLRVPSNVKQYMENIVQSEALKSKLFTPKLEADLGVKLLSSENDHHKIEVKLPVFPDKSKDPVKEPGWETRLRAKQWLFDYQANHSVGTFVWEHFKEEGSPGRLNNGHILENVLVARRHILLPTKFKLHQMEFQKYLGELGITILFEKISSTDFAHEPDYGATEYNAMIKFRPWLIYNAHIWIQGKEKPLTYVNNARKPVFVKSKTVWEMHYKLVKNN